MIDCNLTSCKWFNGGKCGLKPLVCDLVTILPHNTAEDTECEYYEHDGVLGTKVIEGRSFWEVVWNR